MPTHIAEESRHGEHRYPGRGEHGTAQAVIEGGVDDRDEEEGQGRELDGHRGRVEVERDDGGQPDQVERQHDELEHPKRRARPRPVVGRGGARFGFGRGGGRLRDGQVGHRDGLHLLADGLATFGGLFGATRRHPTRRRPTGGHPTGGHPGLHDGPASSWDDRENKLLARA